MEIIRYNHKWIGGYKMEDVKIIWKSKTFWIGVLGVIMGILEAITSDLISGVQITSMGILMIILRTISKSAVKFC